MLARVCGHTPTLPICRDVAESLKFITLLNTVRAMAPIPLFSTPGNFLDFLEGKGGERDLYPLLRTMLGDRAPAMLFVPASLDASTRAELEGLLATSAKIITIQSTGIVGNARVTIRSVVNFHDRWSPPPPNAGSLPGLGVFHYYRIE